jgi:NADPH-dependent glutamate synthase beta subunit-like oxidoreductase/ferredoxin
VNPQTPIVLTIDGREVQTDQGRTVLEAALEAGIYIPHLCHHPDLRPVGSCGLCSVEIDGMNGLQSSCLTQAEDKMVIQTKTDRLDRMRRLAMELLLADHPSECLECSQYLNCELQSVKQYLGISEELRIRRRIKPIPIQTNNPLFVHDFTRCIRCGRCVRACNELRGIGVISFIHHGQETRIGTAFDRTLAEAGCRFCGACVEVCPTGAIRDHEELVKGKKRKSALVPCRFTCPAQIDVPRYIRLVREEKYSEATAVIREKVPFPKILGHICQHPCEGNCRRGEINEPIAIRDLKRFAAEKDTLRLWEQNAIRKPSTDQRVAVVGAGPAGLTAAVYLTKAGHAVTVFDAMPEAGGMLRYGIPAYRLPRDVLDEEIEEITKLGIAIQTDTKIESLEKLTYDDDFDAVLVAVGTQAGQKLPIEGNDLAGVLDGLAFLKEVNRGRAVAVGEKIVVLGGGNVAFDCARVARRLGASAITIACLEKKEEMPAACDEIEEGEEEGITVLPMRTFTRILESDGRVAGVACLKVASFQFDEDGGVDIEVIEGSEHVLEADMVFFAIGQSPEIPEEFDLECDERGRIEVDPYTMDTDQEGIFAAGDAVLGTTSVIQAIASGRRSAMAVDRYLGGDGDIEETLAPPQPPEKWLGPEEQFARYDRCAKYCIGVEERLDGFCCLTQTLDEQEAAQESSRCLQCDLRLKIAPVRFWGDY